MDKARNVIEPELLVILRMPLSWFFQTSNWTEQCTYGAFRVRSSGLPVFAQPAGIGSGPDAVMAPEMEAFARIYVAGLEKRTGRTGRRKLQKLLELQRTYPPEAFRNAVEKALRYNLYDLRRLENLILSFVAGEFFNLKPED